MTSPARFEKVRSVFFFGLVGLLTFSALVLMWPLVYPIFWAAVVAVLFYPLFNKIEKHVKMPTMSSVITMVLVVVMLFLPLYFVIRLLVIETAQIYLNVDQAQLVGTANSIAAHLQDTMLGPLIERAQTEWPTHATNAARVVSVYLVGKLSTLSGNLLSLAVSTFAFFYTLFYFFKEGPRILGTLMHLSPLGDVHERMLFQRFLSTTRATFKSSLIIGVVQGVVGWILFAAVGMNGAFVAAVLMTAVSIIPAIGSFIVWLPIGLYMLLAGSLASGIIILVVGAAIISNIDNVMRPALVGKDTQMHPLLVFFSVVGGLLVLGVSGFIVGPILMSLFLAVVSIYDHYYARELKHN